MASAGAAGEKSPLTVQVVSAKPKLPARQSRISSFVEVAADGLSSETKKTGKRIGGTEVLWNESLMLNVTAQSHLDVKLWSCHTLWNELLGAASFTLSGLQQQSKGKGGNKPLTLDLQVEHKGSLVSGGEVTVLLKGPAVEGGSVPNGGLQAEEGQLNDREVGDMASSPEGRHPAPSTNCSGNRPRGHRPAAGGTGQSLTNGGQSPRTGHSQLGKSEAGTVNGTVNGELADPATEAEEEQTVSPDPHPACDPVGAEEPPASGTQVSQPAAPALEMLPSGSQRCSRTWIYAIYTCFSVDSMVLPFLTTTVL